MKNIITNQLVDDLCNKAYQRCQLVRDTAAALNIELLFLPAYSPQFNLIERFWKLVKKCCLHTHNYPTFSSKLPIWRKKTC